MEYNEDKAIEYIRGRMTPETANAVNDDEILNVIDMIWDFYDDNGMLEINADIDDSDTLDTEALIAYVKKMVSKDRRSPLKADDVEAIVLAELDYEDSISED